MVFNNVCGIRVGIVAEITAMILLKKSVAAPAIHNDGCTGYIGKG